MEGVHVGRGSGVKVESGTTRNAQHRRIRLKDCSEVAAPIASDLALDAPIVPWLRQETS